MSSDPSSNPDPTGHHRNRAHRLIRPRISVTKFAGIVVLRLADQANVTVEAAIRRLLELVGKEPLAGSLWIVEDRRIRIRG